MPYISTEALVGGALLVVLAFGYQYLPTSPPTADKVSKKKTKKKLKADTSTASDQGGDGIVPVQAKALKKERRKGDGVAQISISNGVTSSNSIEGDGLLRDKSGDQVTNVTAGPTQPPSAQPKPRTLAEKIAPRPRKTRVDDMLAPEDLPATRARVMKVVNPSSSVPNSDHIPLPDAAPTLALPVDERVIKYSDDYESSAHTDETSGTGVEVEEDDGWNVVATKSKKPVSLSLSSSAPSTPSSQPLPVSTKIQRKNAKKAEMKKAAREAEEGDRQKRLAMHRKDLEREKINDIYVNKKKESTSKSGTSGKGGATATVDANGKLIWD